MRSLLTLLTVLLVATACSAESGSDDDASTPTTQWPPQLELEPVADVPRAVALAHRDGDPALYVADRARGEIHAVVDGEIDGPPVLEVAVSNDVEQGLLGLTFHPDGDRLYVDYTDPDGDTHVVEYPFDGDPIDPSDGRELLTLEQPFVHHNGGHLLFGPDGHLYVGVGDGGGGGDPDDRAQDRGDLLGSILRIDPAPDGDLPYTVPDDNPFVGDGGARPEIWLYGLRHPWRFSFDAETGDLWVADVGENQWEEINRVPAGQGGANLGWNLVEGTHEWEGEPPPGHLPPVHEYAHEDGRCAVIGGYVDRSSSITSLHGSYLFGDFCTGELAALRQTDDGVEVAPLGVQTDALSAFAEAPDGEIYVLSLEAGVQKLTAVG